MFLPILEKALDYVVQKIWNDNKELIRQVIYESYQPTTYHRTKEFQNAWDTETNIMGNKARGIFKYAPDKIEQSILYNGEDFREYLAETIYQGLSGDFGYGTNNGSKRYAKNNPLFAGQAWTQKRNVWNVLKREIGINKIKKYFEEGMRNNGINFSSHKDSVRVTTYDD